MANIHNPHNFKVGDLVIYDKRTAYETEVKIISFISTIQIYAMVQIGQRMNHFRVFTCRLSPVEI